MWFGVWRQNHQLGSLAASELAAPACVENALSCPDAADPSTLLIPVTGYQDRGKHDSGRSDLMRMHCSFVPALPLRDERPRSPLPAAPVEGVFCNGENRKLSQRGRNER